MPLSARNQLPKYPAALHWSVHAPLHPLHLSKTDGPSAETSL